MLKYFIGVCFSWITLQKQFITYINYIIVLSYCNKMNVYCASLVAILLQLDDFFLSLKAQYTIFAYHHTIIRAAFVCLCVCLFVCSLYPPRSFDGSSPNLVGVCRWTSHLPLRGSFSKRSTGRRVNGSLSLSTILYMHQPHATQLQRCLLLCCYCCRV